MSSLFALTALEIARLVSRREAGAVEVVEAHLAHIEAVDGRVNALVQVDAERALATARDIDAEAPRAGERGLLRGVPFTVKDNIAVAGLVMAIGVPERRDVVATDDATVVRRMRDAGAIFLGKTNCPPYGGGIETDNPVYGRTNNPWDLDRTPGGSSGGEAAAIAARESPCGLGTDSGASVRLPAHFCGLAAIKPTAGRVPLAGVLDDEGPLGTLSDPRTQIGPLARSVADVAALLQVVTGPDGIDGGVAPVALPVAAAVDPRGLRVAVQTENGHSDPTPETVVAVRAAAAALAEAGCRVADAAPPPGGHELTVEVWRSYGADDLTAADLWRLLRRWDDYRRRMLAFAADHDLLVTPVFAEPARRHGEMNRPGEANPTDWTTPHNLTGSPAATVRAGTSPEGLPLGVQIVAAPWRDELALAAALGVERALGPWPAPPLDP